MPNKLQQYFTLLLCIFATLTMKGQNEITGVIPCIDSILNNLNTKTRYSEVEIINTNEKKVVLKDKGTIKTFNNKNIVSWLSDATNDTIKAYKLNNHENEAYLLSCKFDRATGLATNFFMHIVVIPSIDYATKFESLGENKKLIYFNDKTNNIEFISFTYGDNFFWKRDFDNPDFTIETNEIVQKEIKLIESINIFCPK